MIQAIRSASGVIAITFLFVAAGSTGAAQVIASIAVAAFFAHVQYQEAQELGFFNR